MRYEEEIATYMLRVNEVINTISVLGEKIEDVVIIKKVLRSLPSRFDYKVSANEDAKDINSFWLDEMHGSLKTYEMGIGKRKIFDI